MMFCLVTVLSRGTSETAVADSNHLDTRRSRQGIVREFITSQSPLPKGSLLLSK